MPDFYTWFILLNNQSEENGEQQLSVLCILSESATCGLSLYTMDYSDLTVSNFMEKINLS